MMDKNDPNYEKMCIIVSTHGEHIDTIYGSDKNISDFINAKKRHWGEFVCKSGIDAKFKSHKSISRRWLSVEQMIEVMLIASALGFALRHL